MRRLLCSAFAIFAVASVGCSESEVVTESVFVVPASLSELSEETFFDHPWPSDFRLENGSPRVLGYYNPKAVPIISQYVEALGGTLDGFSPAAAGYVRFNGPLDPKSLPANPKEGLQKTASVQLVDIDSESPEYGARKLVTLLFREEGGVYWLPNTLAFMPTPGFPLRAHTRYAFVVTDKIRAKEGGTVKPGPDLAEVLGITDPTDRTADVRQVFVSAITELEKAGVTRESIVQMTTFRTSDPTAELFLLADDVAKNVAAPKVDPDTWQHSDIKLTYDVYTGVYGPSPNYQAGKLPFKAYGEGGQLNVINGLPEVVNTFNLRFSLSVPKANICPMPDAGYPIVLYAHGTGGDYQSYLQDGTAKELAQRCLASMGVDQIFHGTRPGAPGPDATESSVQILFFNFENPIAARSNPRQGAIDEVQRARLFTETQTAVPAGLTPNGAEVRFDPSKVLYFGHSQGGLSGPLYLASAKTARGGVLSGAGAIFGIALLEKTEPQPSIKDLVANIFLNLTADESAELNLLHPAISLAQSIVDVTDTIHYGRFIATEPRSGFAPKSIYMTEGINPDGVGDSFAPPHGIEAHGISIGLPLQLPGQRAIEETAWGGPVPVSVPPEGLSGNMGNGQASGIFAQWPIALGDDGHFVIFDQPAAGDQAAEFLKALGEDPKGRVPAPP